MTLTIEATKPAAEPGVVAVDGAEELVSLPSGWNASSIGAEFTVQLGKMLDAAKNSGVEQPYVGNRAVQWNRIDVENLATVPLTPTDLQKYRLRSGDLLVCEGGEVGRSAIWRDELPECYYQKALHRLRSINGFDPYLMMCFFQLWSDSGCLDNFVTKTSIAHLPKEKLVIVPLPVPPKPEQRAIAATLSDVDSLIAALNALIAKKRAIKQAAMQQLLTGKTRLPGFAGEWALKPLGEVAEIVSGGTPKTGVPEYWGGGIPWCTPTDITGTKGKYLFGTERTISRAGLHASSARLLPKGTLLLCSRATIGELRIATGPVCTNQGFKSLMPLPGYDGEFLYYLMSTKKPEMLEKAIGSTFLEISKRDIASLDLSMPSLPEQQAIARVLSDMDAEIEALEARVAKTRDIKQGMMQQLLTGRIRLPVPTTAAEESPP